MVTSPKTKLTLRLSDSRLYLQLAQKARRMNRSLNFAAEQCLKSALAEFADKAHVIALSRLEAKAGQIRITEVPEGQ
jgi:hypothetical protein